MRSSRAKSPPAPSWRQGAARADRPGASRATKSRRTRQSPLPPGDSQRAHSPGSAASRLPRRVADLNRDRARLLAHRTNDIERCCLHRQAGPLDDKPLRARRHGFEHLGARRGDELASETQVSASNSPPSSAGASPRESPSRAPHGALTITLKPATGKFQLTIASPALAASKALATRAKHHNASRRGGARRGRRLRAMDASGSSACHAATATSRTPTTLTCRTRTARSTRRAAVTINPIGSCRFRRRPQAWFGLRLE